jgi:MFS family permease
MRFSLLGFYLSHGISATGTKMTMVALPLLVYATTGSAGQTGVVAFVQMGLYVIAKALGAPLIDQLGRRRVAVGSDLVAATVIGAVPLLYFSDALPFAVLLVLLAAGGAAQGLGNGAYRVLLPDIVDATGANLERALTVFDGVDRCGSLIGAPLGGALVAVIGGANVLWFDAASYFISAALLVLAVRMPLPAAAIAATQTREPYLHSLRAGWRFLRNDRLLLGLSVMVAVTNMLDQAKVAVMMPVWITDVIGDPALSGLIFGAAGLGAVCGNVVFIWLVNRLPRHLTFSVAFLLAGVTQFYAMAVFTNAITLIALAFASGVCAAALNPILSAVSYERVPDAMRTRAFGLTGAVAFVGIPFGGLLGGLAVSSLGVINALWLAGTVYLVTTLVPFVFPVWRQMNRPKPVAEDTEPSLAQATA